MIYVNHGNTNMTKLKLQSALKTNQTKNYTALFGSSDKSNFFIIYYL